MSFEDLQRAWQAQDTEHPISIRPDLLLKEVRRNQRYFWITIFWRDVRELGVAILLTAYFAWDARAHHNWAHYLSALACAGVGAFMVVDRLLQRSVRPAPTDSLKQCIEASLAQVKHQIWLLRNVFWWYLLPLLVASVISIVHSHAHARNTDGAVIGLALALLLTGWITRWVYRLNQAAVQKRLEPRREELEALLAALEQRGADGETKKA